MSTSILEREQDSNSNSSDDSHLEGLIKELESLRAEMLQLEADAIDDLSRLHVSHSDSARNLIHYLALRRHDLRPIQEQLATQGLSSLGRAESHVKSTIDAIAGVLYRLTNTCEAERKRLTAGQSLSYEGGTDLLMAHTEKLLGPKPTHRIVRIMVTVPSEAAENYELVRDLLTGGMD